MEQVSLQVAALRSLHALEPVLLQLESLCASVRDLHDTVKIPDAKSRPDTAERKKKQLDVLS